MARSKTPSFITEIPLYADAGQEKILLKRLDMARRIYNACLGEILNRAINMKADESYKVACDMPKSEPKSRERKARNQAFGDLRETYQVNEYSLHSYAKQFSHSYLGLHLDANTVQKIATRAYRAVNDWLTIPARGKPRFKGKNQFDTVEGKSNKSGILWREKRVVWNTKQDRLVLEPILNPDDPVIRHGLKSRVKYLRLVRRKLNGRNRFYVQLVGEGGPHRKPKNKLGRGAVGMDLGPQTIAFVSPQAVSLELFAAELERRDKEIKALQRKIERQRRANNPDNYEPDRWVRSKGGQRWIRKKGKAKKGKRTWAISNGQRANERRLAELHRKQAAHRKSLHGNLVNRILAMGDTFKLEKVSYKVWQKMFGRSIQFRAPGIFVSMLRRKAESAGGVVDEFPTRTTKLSQVCICGSIEKKSLSQRWHNCPCGVFMQRDLFSGFLALCVEDDKLNAARANELWTGLETGLWAALGKIKSASANGSSLPKSIGLDPGVCLIDMFGDGADRPESLYQTFAKSLTTLRLATAMATTEPHVL